MTDQEKIKHLEQEIILLNQKIEELEITITFLMDENDWCGAV